MTDKNPCLKCQDYRNCPYGEGKPWYHYGEIRFCLFQILFIIENEESLERGDWPINPDGSSYIDPNIKTGFGSEAYYCKTVEIIAEVNYRLARTGVDGKLLREQVLRGVEYNDLDPEARSALMYMKGMRRKRMSYKAWIRKRRYENKVTKT